MSALEKLKYIPPNAMTLGRPFLGAEGMMQAFDGNWGAATLWFMAAWASDMDGTVARATNSVSKFGSFADPAADNILRLEMGAALISEFTPAILMITALAEGVSLAANVKMHNGKKGEAPHIPLTAKAGTVGHGIGGAAMMYGLASGNEAAVTAGEGLIAFSSVVRGGAYVNLYRKGRSQEIDTRREDRLPRRR